MRFRIKFLLFNDFPSYIGCFHLPYSYKLFQATILLELRGDGAVKVVTVGNCYIY